MSVVAFAFLIKGFEKENFAVGHIHLFHCVVARHINASAVSPSSRVNGNGSAHGVDIASYGLFRNIEFKSKVFGLLVTAAAHNSDKFESSFGSFQEYLLLLPKKL